MVNAMLQELELQAGYLRGEPIETIYFGGGTPSLLDESDLEKFFNALTSHLSLLTPELEVTLEANPDDLTKEKLAMLRRTPVNRLSIGIQSFSEEDLRFMNRAHSASEALTCVEWAHAAGFHDLTIDLIYGSPTTSDEQWQHNLDTLTQFDIPHLSSYCLTVEERTALAHFVKTGKAKPVNEEQAARQFDMLVEWAKANGYEHYEISNFAKPGRYSRHNTAYWQSKKYLGIGPSAHSFDGTSRQWNVANNAQYLRSISEGIIPSEKEVLTPEQRYNEYVMTGLRTMWGVSLQSAVFSRQLTDEGGNPDEVRIGTAVPVDFQKHFLRGVQPYLEQGILEREGDVFRLTKEGKFLADGVAAALFV